MGVKEIADRYISRDGGAPSPHVEPSEYRPTITAGPITLTEAEYKMLLNASEAADEIRRCFRCGAWMHMDEPVYCREPEDGIEGCWRAMTGEGACVSHRALK